MDKDKKVQDLLEQGLYHYGLGQTSVAVDLWRQVIELDPNNEVAREYLSIELGADWEEKGGEGGKRLDKDKLESVSGMVSKQSLAERAYSPEFGLGQEHLRNKDAEQGFKVFSRLADLESGNLVYQSYLELSKVSLIKDFINRVGSLSRMPILVVRLSALTDLKLTEEEGFILSLINGETSFEDIVSLAPVAPFITFSTLKKLLELKVIGIKEG